MAHLDTLIWRPRSFRVLDTGNRPLQGVWPPSAAAGLALIGQGTPAAAVMAELRSGVRAVDLDLSAKLSGLARDAILDWARARNYPALVRPSGKPGHMHILIAGPGHHSRDSALDDLCEALRRELGPPRKPLRFGAIDPRRSGSLRTLTSPHRHGLCCEPITGDIAAFTAAVEALPPATPAATPRKRAVATTNPALARATAAIAPPTADPDALIPRPRTRRELPEHIATWLTTGTEWTITGGHDHSGSTRELIATAAMVRAGWSHFEAWTGVLTAHPAAMSHARRNQARWTRLVWNRAVTDNHDRPDATEPLAADIARDLTAARARLDETARLRLTPRARPAILLVADDVLHMMARKRTRRASVARRTLHEDLDLSLPTIGAALEWLDRHGVIVLDRSTLDRRPSRRASTSYEAVLPTAPADPDTSAEDQDEEVRENCPPRSHTPLGDAHLPRCTNQILRTLRHHGPLRLEDLAVAGLMTQDSNPTPSELRTVREAVRHLAEAGWVQVDAEGRWRMNPAGPTVEAQQVSARARAARTATVTAEREAYRSSPTSDWSIARAAAIKAQRAKEKAWWNSLTREEQIDRRAEWAMRYAALPLAEQVRVRDRLTSRRVRDGIDEATYQRRWADTFTPQQWADRTAMRAAIHHTLPVPEHVARVAAWDHHRTRWNLPRTCPTPPVQENLSGR